jgi:hypothetical protein
MKTYTLIFMSLLIAQIFCTSCGLGSCPDTACCACRENPNQETGNGFLDFDPSCLANGGGLHCVADTGCKLCYKPTFAALNVGNRPICQRFAALGLTSKCTNEACCLMHENPNPTNGVGYYEWNSDCYNNGGGLHCVADTGCRLCYKPVLGGTNVGDRPTCQRFLAMTPAPFTFPPVCSNETCCIDAQSANDDDGNGFLEFNNGCKNNGGGQDCVGASGCRLCYKPVVGGTNVGNRPICHRYLNLLPICSSPTCCYDLQIPNLSEGSGFLEFDLNCKLLGGGLHCVGASGCRLCYMPVLGGINLGGRPVCSRFQ